MEFLTYPGHKIINNQISLSQGELTSLPLPSRSPSSSCLPPPSPDDKDAQTNGTTSLIYHVCQDMIPGVIPAHVGPDDEEVQEGGDKEPQGQVGGQQGQQGARRRRRGGPETMEVLGNIAKDALIIMEVMGCHRIRPNITTSS